MPKYVRQLSFTPQARSLINLAEEFLRARNVKAYLVGGTVRDAISGKPTNDIDIAVDGPALELSQQLADASFGAFVAMNEEHRVARIVLERDGTGWHLDISSLQGTLADDMSRRDFSVDSMAVPLVHLERNQTLAEVYDDFGGINDLAGKKIRHLNDHVFKSDPVRMLRAVRLAVQLGFTIDRPTNGLIRNDSKLLTIAPAERLREEFCRILAFPRAAGSIRAMDSLGLLGQLLPELDSSRGVSQPLEHYWNVFDHSIETMNATEAALRINRNGYAATTIIEIPWTAEIASYIKEEVSGSMTRATLVKLAALFHDIAKPETKNIDDNGRMHFFGHPKLGAEKIIAIMKRLRFSTKETLLVEKLVEHHLRPGLMSTNQELPTKRAIYRYYRDTHPVSLELLYLNLADYLAARGPLLQVDEWRMYAARIRHILAARSEEPKTVAPALLVNGTDLMNVLGLGPGPAIGILLEVIREAQAAGEVTNRQEALSLATRELERQYESGLANGNQQVGLN